MKRLIFTALALIGTTAIADLTHECNKGKIGSIVIELGKVTRYCAGRDHQFFLKSQSKGSFFNYESQYVFVSGMGAKEFAKEFAADLQENIPELKESLRDYIFPIVDENKNIVGTAFRYDGQTLTALHTVNTASRDKPLYIYDYVSDKSWKITGYAPSKRAKTVNAINYYDDFCLLEVRELNYAPSFPRSQQEITSIFQYLEISYPRNNSALKDPSVFSSHLAQSKTDAEKLVLLNRNGQDFNSSGGPIIEANTSQVRALNICIENKTNAVKAIDLSRINQGIDEALAFGFIPSLDEIKYDFTYADKCPPIGGRGSGP